jgi:hypothetical protein
MKTTIISIVLLSCISLSFSTPASQVKNDYQRMSCTTLKVHMAEAVDKMLIILNPEFQSFNSSKNFVDNYCIPFTDWFAVTKEYKRCLKSFSKSLYALVMNNIKKKYKTFCLSSKDQAVAYAHTKCLNHKTKNEVQFLAKQMKAFFQVRS